ncbi:hypothetical protein ACH35V_37835 [Actinomadura sp. 1N219]|uniref:hypothetical protein n=1 Tax=Actinomadura sp. 1N219 TaxID=3375152 RepID=UPI0037B15A69
MADAIEIDGRGKSDDGDKLDGVMTNLARGRIALGLAALAAPKLTVRLMGMGSGADAGRDYLVRAFGAREVALGAGYLLSGDESGRRLWTRLGLAVDALDTLSAVKTRPGLPLWVTAGAVGVAGGAAGLGAAKVARDLLG